VTQGSRVGTVTPVTRTRPLILITQAGPARWDEGVQVVLAAQAWAGLPDPDKLPPQDLAARTRRRQSAALGVWLALAGEQVIGHALIEPLAHDHPDWARVDDPAVVAARSAGALVELGGLAVTRDWSQAGVGGALLGGALDWVAARPELLAVACVWRASAASAALTRRRGGRRVWSAPLCDLYVYDRQLA